MCVDMCVGMRVGMCVGMCVGICVGSSKALSIFSCEQIVSGKPAGEYMRAQPSIRCWQGEHITLVVLASFLMVFYVAMPALTAYILFVLGGRGVRIRSADFKASFGFIYVRFTRSVPWWHIVVLVRQIIIVVVRNFALDQTPLIQFVLILNAVGLYALACFAIRPFKDRMSNLFHCGLEFLLITLSLGGLLHTEYPAEGTWQNWFAFVGLWATVVTASALMVWAIARDLSLAVSRTKIQVSTFERLHGTRTLIAELNCLHQAILALNCLPGFVGQPCTVKPRRTAHTF